MNKKTLLTLLTIFWYGLNSVFAQCGPTGITANPQPVAICQGDSIDIIFSSAGNCTGTYEYEVMQGATIVQPWSAANSYNAMPFITTSYTVNVRCSACPANVISQDFEVEVTEQPSVTGNLLVCSGGSTTLTATGTASTIDWWDSQAGTSQLSSTGGYVTSGLLADSTFWVHASSSVSGAGGSILITECGLDGAIGGTGSEDYIEISNLYTTAVNTSGWVCAVSDSYTNINSSNGTTWNLPASFSPCSVVTRTDEAGSSNYWGNNIFWNSTSSSWAIIIDDVGNVVDFIAWGWSAADLATFNPTINGFSVTLGVEWTGNGCVLPCGSAGGVQYSFARTGGADTNTEADFICQPTSVDLVNPGLSCGWTSTATCPYPVTVVVDVAPTASDPATINVECIGDVPLADPLVVIDEADDITTAPVVTFEGEVSDGLSCPETITRTYRVTDDCGNFTDVYQDIVIEDITPPVIASVPVNVVVQCSGDIPSMIDLNWTDNCDGNGTISGVDVSDGNSCPEVITRSWVYTDACGNTTTVSQTITIDDTTPPTASNPPLIQIEQLPPPDINVITDESDNCTTSPLVEFVSDISDGEFCPETVTRTYRIVDDCGNETFVTQLFTVGDPIPNASFTASETSLSGFMTDVDFTNTSIGAVAYLWDFGDDSPTTTAEHTSHTFPDDATGGYWVELVAFSPFGCTDTFDVFISVKEELVFFMPNSFTPDGDEYNQSFQPVFTTGFDPFDFNMYIYNRWGETVFESHDATVAWDGTFNGKRVPDGTYSWVIRFKLSDVDDREVHTGHVTIFK